jgi:hypothetical protein
MAGKFNLIYRCSNEYFADIFVDNLKNAFSCGFDFKYRFTGIQTDVLFGGFEDDEIKSLINMSDDIKNNVNFRQGFKIHKDRRVIRVLNEFLDSNEWIFSKFLCACCMCYTINQMSRKTS